MRVDVSCERRGALGALFFVITQNRPLRQQVDAASLHPGDMLPYLEHMTHVDLPMFLRMLRAAGEHSAADILCRAKKPDARASSDAGSRPRTSSNLSGRRPSHASAGSNNPDIRAPSDPTSRRRNASKFASRRPYHADIERAGPDNRQRRTAHTERQPCRR